MSEHIDPVRLEVLWSRLISIAEEQARALINASFSMQVGEMEDLACGIFDGEGNLLSQGVTGTQGILTGLSRGVKEALKKLPSSQLHPGDVLVCNDPWMFTGHKNDIAVVTPVFRANGLVAIVATALHCSDIGGLTSAGDCRSNFEEGLAIPVMKLFKGGERNQDLFEIIEANVRVPREVIGDLMAQVAANEVGGAKLLEFMEEYSLPSLSQLSKLIISTTEQAVRREVAALPNGVYRHETLMDGIDEPLKVVATLTIAGAEIRVDFSGSSPQTSKAGINSVLNFTTAYAAHAIKSVLVPDVPNNDGLFKCVEVFAPEGCILNPRPPAPVLGRHAMVVPISEAVFGALSQVVPERVISESAGGTFVVLSGEASSGKGFVYWIMESGGTGARPDRDGISATMFPANVGVAPVEIMENVSPLFVTEKEFRQDSGGPGKQRGGCDQVVTVKVRSDHPSVVACFFERTKFPATGYQGGLSGMPADITVNHVVHPHPKGRYHLQPGDLFSFSLGGGGGYGPPKERDPELVLKDVADGLVSLDAARRYYGVAISEGSLTIDWEETNRLRKTD